ncbi:MAG: hypothetical protein WD098_03835 [Balneolales bacterium]
MSVTGCDGNNNQNIAYEQEYTMILTEGNKQPVSDYLLGFNLIYPYENDDIWQDGKIAKQLQDVGAAMLRYPGGTVTSFYHWDALTGRGWEDSWNPGQSSIPEPESNFMDVDQYMELIRTTGATPLVGINITSGWLHDRMEDGIQEAIGLMQYCKDNNFDVEYWYLDNEPYHRTANGGIKTPKEYAELINAYAGPMKEFDPDIKIIANWNNAFELRRNEYEELLAIAGDYIDIIDVHYYWSWNKPTMEFWLSHTPTRMHTGKSYIEELTYFKQMVTELGYPDIRLASLEWNVGPIREGQITPDQAALIQAEILMQFMIGGLDMATFWPMHHHSSASKNRTFVEEDDKTLKPVYPIFKFLGQLQGSTLINEEVSNDLPHVVSLAAMDDEVIRMAFLNKNEFNIRVNVASELLEDGVLLNGNSYVLIEDNSHELNSAELIHHEDDEVSYIARGSSLTMLTFKKSN